MEYSFIVAIHMYNEIVNGFHLRSVETNSTKQERESKPNTI